MEACYDLQVVNRKRLMTIIQEDVMSKVYIVGAKRTPIGRFGGALASLSAIDLGSKTINAALTQAEIKPENVDQVLMGNVIQAGEGQNPARQAAIAAGLPQSVPAITINDVCGSGLSSINMAAALIKADQAQIVVGGGMESMSNAPYLIKKARFGYQLGNGELVDAIENDALNDAWGGYPMGMTAENVADKYGVSRQQMDEFALKSHQKAINAIDNAAFDSEIIPISVTTKKSTFMVQQDESPRSDTSLEKLAKLKPVFKVDGQVTAGNSSGLNDGSAAVVLASGAAVQKFNLTPLAEWKDSSIVGLDPEYMGMGPHYAIDQLLNSRSLSIEEIDTFELNEAFASQSIACIDQLNIDEEKVNPNGGALALGHPVGASGSRIFVSLIYDLINQDKQTGIASLCVGGGMGVATLVTR